MTMSEPRPPLDLDAIWARADKATPGPWHKEHDEYGCVDIGNYGWVATGPFVPQYDVDSPQGQADAEFIAHAREDVPALLAEVTALRAELDAVRALRTRMGELARQLSVGWDDEPNPDQTYLAYGKAFKEAARRIRAELEATDD